MSEKPDLQSMQASAFFTADHHHCDSLWAEVESAVDAGDAAKIKSAWETFATHTENHFAMEEEVLFPALEEVMGMSGGGPTMVMRSEHQRMRGLISEMRLAHDDGEFETLVDHGETLVMLVGQHNAKEEGILYPMADQGLGEAWPKLQQQLKAYWDRV